MAVAPQNIILQLAQTGNLKAISLLLNRKLSPLGMQAQLSQDDQVLCIFVTFSSGAQQTVLLQTVRQFLSDLQLTVYTAAKLYQQYESGDPEPIATLDLPIAAVVTDNSTGPEEPPQRCSIPQFLERITCLEDLLVLRNHPFITHRCPQCGETLEDDHRLPKRRSWDCSACDWTDTLNLGQVHQPAALSAAQPLVDVDALRARTVSKRLGQYLVEAGLLTPEQVQVGLAEQQRTGQRLGQVLVQRGWIKQATVEYLMEKVILPERLDWHDATYQALSRHLIKALMPPASTTDPASDGEDGQTEASHASSAMSRQSPDQPPSINERSTLVLASDNFDEFVDA